MDSFSENGNNRYRLSPEEIKILQQYRNTGTVPDDQLIRSDRSIVTQNAKYQALRKKYQMALAELEGMYEREEILEKLHNTDFTDAQHVLKLGRVRKENTKGRCGSQSVAFSLASDWHFGEYVNPETINGLNEFDIKIAKKRIANFFERTLYLCQLMRHETRIDTLCLALMGDLICGYIHEELEESAECSPTEALIELVSLIRDGLNFLSDEGKFDEIVVPCVFGNHGRTTKKPRIATAYKNSYEYLLYTYLSVLFENHDKIVFQVSKGHHLYRDIFGKYRVRFHHGDLVKYQGGVGGITIPVNKAIAQWNRSKRAYLDVFGHFHQLKDGGHWICNSSLIGYNAFALSIKAEFEPPRQGFFTIEKKLGKTFTAPIFLDKEENIA